MRSGGSSLVVLAVVAFLAAGLLPLERSHAAPPDEAPQEALAAAGQARVRFEPNMGQAAAEVRYIGYTADGLVLLGDASITFIAAPPGDAPEPDSITLRFTGASPRTVAGDGLQAAVSHHYVGNDPSAWRTDVPHFSQVRYSDLYPGIDMVVYGTETGHLEFDHILAPGASPATIRFTVDGATPRLAGKAVDLHSGAVDFRLDAPVAFQDHAGTRMPVAARYVIGDDVRIVVGPYDPTRTLTIDPVLKYASYVGATGSDYGRGIGWAPGATPAKTDVYISGYQVTGTTIPVGFTNAGPIGPGGGAQSFVAKLTYDRGTRLAVPQWYAYFGGSSTDYAYDAAVDRATGRIAVTGYTSSTNFPAMNPLLIPSAGFEGSLDPAGTDAFVSVLSSTGAYLFGSYLGGSGTDYGYGVNWGPNGHVLVTGYTTLGTTGPDFPTYNGPMVVRPYTTQMAFAAKLDITTSPASAVFSTFIGAAGSTYGYAIAEDATGVIFGGYTTTPAGTPAFPTTAGAYQTTPGTWWAGYLAKVPSAGGSNWAYSTLLDWNDDDIIWGIAVDGAGRTWVTGYTWSTNLPTNPSSFQPFRSGGYDAFLLQISSNGATIPYATYMGGTGTDYAYDVAVAGTGHILVTGYTSSTNFPVFRAQQPTSGGGAESWIMRFESTGALNFSTYHGGSSTEYGYGVAGDANGNIFTTGYTQSANFPMVTPHQPTLATSPDAFIGVYGKSPPKPVVTAITPGYLGRDSPQATPYTVLTGEPITLRGLNSTAGDFGINLAASKWTLTLPSGSYITTGTLTPTFSVGPVVLADNGVGSACLELTDTDASGYDSKATSCMNLRWLNRPPVPTVDLVSPVPVQVGNPVTLQGSAIDPDGTVVSHAWFFNGQHYAGSSIVATAPMTPGIHVARLNVTDDDGANGTVTVNVTVVDGPTADFSWPAGTIVAGDTVGFTDLSVPGSQAIRNWTWQFGDAATASFIAPAPPIVSHTYALPGTYTVRLSIDDGAITSTAAKTLTVVPATPVANADAYSTFIDTPLAVAAPGLLANDMQPYGGPMTVAGVTQPVDGAGASVANVVAQPDGSFLFTPMPGFTGVATFTYTMHDGYVTTTPAPVTVTVSMFPQPTARFDSYVTARQAVFTDQSYIGHWPITQWAWQFGDGQTSFTRHPVHQYETTGTYTVTLTVVDQFGLIGTTTRSIFVTGRDSSPPVPGSDPPVATAPPHRVVREGDTVVLEGASRSGTVFSWQQVSGPLVTLHGADTAHASFIAPTPTGDAATLVFALRVFDGTQFSAPAEVAVIVQGLNRAPVAHLQPELATVAVGSLVTLDGSLSTDPDGDALLYQWQQTAGPAVGALRGERVSFTANEVGAIVVDLTVSDGVRTHSRTAEIRVVPATQAIDARFDVTVAAGLATFSDRSTGPALQYFWDFGDGSADSHLASPLHAYEPGTYTATLLVTDGHGQWSRFSRTVTIDPAADGAAGPDAAEPGFQPGQIEAPQEAKGAPVPAMLGMLAVAIVVFLSRKR